MSSAGLPTPCQHQALAARPETALVLIPRDPRAVTWELPSDLGAPSHTWELPSHTWELHPTQEWSSNRGWGTAEPVP